MKSRVYKPRRKQTAKAGGGSQPFFKNSSEGFFGKAYQSAISGMQPQGVTLHTDAKAAAMAEQVNAKAFTIGSEIFFNTNAYQPGTTDGNKLIAHEIAHATQHQHVAGIKRKDKEEKLNTEKSFKAHATFWNDLNKNFPDAGRKLAGSGYDKKLDFLKADFTEGETKVKGGAIHQSAPTMLIGNRYAEEPDEKQRVSYIPAQMRLIDDWRFKQYRLDDADLDATLQSKLSGLSYKDIKTFEQKMQERTKQTKLSTQAIQDHLATIRFDKYWIDDADIGNKVITQKLAELPVAKLQTYKKEVADFGNANKRTVTGMVDVIDKQIAAAVLKVISTPIAADGTLVLDALNEPEKVTYSVANASIEVLPDTTGSISTPGATSVRPNFDTSVSYNYDLSTGIITRFFTGKGNNTVTVDMPNKIVMTIVTTYQPGVDKLSTSAYGRGTTTADKAAGNTTLQFHEGSHGTDYIVGAKAISYPASLQPGVITKSEYDTFIAAILQVSKDSETTTDEVGYTQSQYYEDHPEKKPK